MPFSKEEFFSRFENAANSCVNFAERHLGQKFPRKYKCILGLREHREQAEREGKIKYLCGRYLARGDMENQSVYKAATYTFCDGKTPTWINLYFLNADDEYSYIQVITSKTITSEEIRDPEHPDVSIQFRIRLSENGEI